VLFLGALVVTAVVWRDSAGGSPIVRTVSRLAELAKGACRTVQNASPAASARSGIILDDAGCICHEKDVTIVELRVETDADRRIGHAFLHLPGRTVGFYPITARDEWSVWDYLLPSAPVCGELRDDSAHSYDRVRRYRLAPRTLARLSASIEWHAADAFQPGDWNGGHNCVTWLSERLKDAGLRPPAGDRPNMIALEMERYEASCDSNPLIADGYNRSGRLVASAGRRGNTGRIGS
jgi:hypothetical protein